MNFCCTECPYAAQFESGLKMHQQLYHEIKTNVLKDKSATVPRIKNDNDMTFPCPRDCGDKSKLKYLSYDLHADFSRDFSPAAQARMSSATRLLGRLRARICRSRQQLAPHPEEMIMSGNNVRVSGRYGQDLTDISDCTSNQLKAESFLSLRSCKEPQVYSCHMCHFDADRITVLDRHLLNDHKIGLDNLLKLVMAKTKDGLADDSVIPQPFIRQPYYKSQNEIIHEDGDFIIESLTPQIKILRHTAINTDLRWQEIANFRECAEFTEELQKMIVNPTNSTNQELMSKIQSINEYMNRFLDSSRHLKRLTKEFDSRYNIRDEKNNGEPYFNLELENPESSSEWERSHSEKLLRHKPPPVSQDGRPRSDRARITSDSYYF